MMIKVNNEYLDFNEPIQIERKVKLFQQIASTEGDFSYEFELTRTSRNLMLLGYPLPDVANKTIYAGIQAELVDDSGFTLYRGILRVGRTSKNTISCSFFSGNYNWIAELSGGITSDVDFSDLDTDLDETAIANTWDNTDGVIFPLIDTGTLVTRGSANLLVDDFAGMIFVKTVFRKIFQRAGLKLSGELLTDPIFNSMLVTRLNVDPDAINARSTFANKSLPQNITAGLLPTFPDPNEEIISFDDDVNYPYYDGSLNNYSPNAYTADVRMRVNIEVFLAYSEISVGPTPTINHIIDFKIFVNGFSVFIQRAPEGSDKTSTIKKELILEAGDVLDIRGYVDANGGTGILTIKADSYLKITPTFLYKAFGNSMVPKWTKADFVNNILSLFCAICDFDPFTKTVTINLFNKIKAKEYVDLSDFFKLSEVDTTEFIDGFYKKNELKYTDSDSDDIKKYNFQYVQPYGSGVIPVDNSHIPPVGTILQSSFKAPVSYVNTKFGMSMDRAIMYDLEGYGSQDFTSVNNSFGNCRLDMADTSAFYRLGIVRIEKSTIPAYNGDWVVTNVLSGSIFIDCVFAGTATGTANMMKHVPSNNDDVFIFINTTYDDNNVSRYSKNTEIQLQENNYSNIGYAFFNLLNMGLPINTDYPESLSLGRISDTLSYQRTMVEKYWPLVTRMLADPLKLIGEGYIPRQVYNLITPLKPVRIRTEETDNLYYLNRIVGYEKSELPCSLELIKLS